MSQNQQITLWPYAGDTPYINFTLNNVNIYFDSAINNEFTIYDNLRINVEETNKYLDASEHIKFGEMSEQPRYAFIISNNSTHIHFMTNCSKLLFSAYDSQYQLSVNIKCDPTYGKDFKDLLTNQFTPDKINIINTRQTIVNPTRSFMYYDCTAIVYQKNERDFADRTVARL